MSDHTSRRKVLGRALASIGISLLASEAAAVDFAAPFAADRDRLLRLFRDRGAAAAFGRQYLRMHPEETDGDRLLATLLKAVEGEPTLSPSRGRDAERLLHRRMRVRIRQEFAIGQTVWVEGVLLARSEARLYALAALA